MISKKLIFSSATIILLLVPVSSVFAQPVPIPVQPPPVLNTPPTIFGQPGTTHNKTPWQLCQSLPLSCGIGGGNTGASQSNSAAVNTNTAQTTASSATAQGACNVLSNTGCHTQSHIYKNNNGMIDSNLTKNNGLSGANLGTGGYLGLLLNNDYGLWSFDPWIQNIVK